MSVKLKIPVLLSLLLLIHIVIFPLGLKAEKGFKFGTWTYGGTTGDVDDFMETLACILKFNYLMDTSRDSSRFQAIEQCPCTLQIAAQNLSRDFTYQGPYYYSFAHYNVWESEGNEKYTDTLNLHHPPEIGDTINDNGTISYKVSASLEPDTLALIQFGPFGYAQDLGFYGVPIDTFPLYPWIDYKASYRVRVGTDLDPETNDTVAILSVAKVQRWSNGDIKYEDPFATDTLWDSDFPDSINYIEHILNWSTEDIAEWDTSGSLIPNKSNKKIWEMELLVRWFGKRDFYIDKVTVYDDDGKALINGERDQEIYNHIQTYHQNSPSLDAWYMREEMHSLGDEVDCVAPWAYVCSCLAEQGDKWGVGSMHGSPHPEQFVDLVEPEELWIHEYPLNGEYYYKKYGQWYLRKSVSYSSDYSGQDSTNLQEAWENNLIANLKAYNQICQENDINYIATLQGHSCECLITTSDTTFPDTFGWYYTLRPFTNYELECQANLAVAHGAKGVLYWKYWTGLSAGPCTCTGLWYQGLQNCEDNDTSKWCWIKNKIGPYFEKLGETYYNLTWLGAGSSDEVGSIDNSFIDSLKSQQFSNSPYIEVAFFDSADTDFFMLVNRRCLPDEDQNVTCHIDKQGKYRIIDLWADDTAWLSTGQSPGSIPYNTELNPGEGRLFKLAPFEGTVINVPGDLPTIQQAIDFALEGDTVLVDTGTYYENIDFKGKGILVASHYIWNEDTSKISQTIIDGSQPAHPDTASVVRFVTFEDSASVIKGFTITGGTGFKGLPSHPGSTYGGGICCYHASPQILNNIVRGNQADNGGGIVCEGGSALMIENQIKENVARGNGGGVCVWSYDCVRIIRNVFTCDTAAWDAGIATVGGDPVILNNTFDQNHSWHTSNEGSVIGLWGGAPVAENNIISNTSNGAAIYCANTGAHIAFNDFWNNADGDFYGCGNILGDSTWGTNFNNTPCDSFSNVFRDPRYVDPDNGDFRLRDSSDCINAGDTLTCGDPDISRCHIDIGAQPFEYVCGDVDSSGEVDAVDVVYLKNYLFEQGPPPEPRVSAEVNCQWPIGLADLVYLINYVYKSGAPPCQNCPS